MHIGKGMAMALLPVDLKTLKPECEGQPMCHLTGFSRSTPMIEIKKEFKNLPDGIIFKSGHHVVCHNLAFGPTGFCAFFENLKDGVVGTSDAAKELFEMLYSKCDHCAKIRLDPTDRNNNGTFKVDYVGWT
ncbi:sexual differentiation process protein isp4 [Purpureocillium lavendulum]|uniref:Sexual differentiation process protein isp4 n=1 Tax=Purpureocillium lavendulum TaxID=1247861 RepID=A0AB34G8N5_9HYPO|nr:sexual differentiation process protein isp4 [Purpureocillium lavendulum]